MLASQYRWLPLVKMASVAWGASSSNIRIVPGNMRPIVLISSTSF